MKSLTGLDTSFARAPGRCALNSPESLGGFCAVVGIPSRTVEPRRDLKREHTQNQQKATKHTRILHSWQ